MATWDPREYNKGEWISGDDLEDGERMVCTIKTSYMNSFERDGKTDNRPVLEFLETDQKLTLNKKNNKKLLDMFGDDPEEWDGKQISIMRNPVDFNGRHGVVVGPPPKRTVKQAPVDDEVVFEQPTKKRKPAADDPFDEDSEPPF